MDDKSRKTIVPLPGGAPHNNGHHHPLLLEDITSDTKMAIIEMQKNGVPSRNILNIATPTSMSTTIASEERSCRVIIVNTIDYHHEVIESVVNRFPLPWDTFNCSTKLPIIYDFCLFQDSFPDRAPFHIGDMPKHLNMTEFWGWKDYFEKFLQYRNITRSINDGTVAYSRDFVSLRDDEPHSGAAGHNMIQGLAASAPFSKMSMPS
mmetsp:Transcript_6752/g.12703  ORF Transcript_6752/g.12703 Transcript_6752/m.12703 type:complete len:206 (-) Transcript_6752:733-1350(-)